MKNSRLIACVACSFFAALAVPAVEAQPVVPRLEWGALPASFPSGEARQETGWLVVPERRFPAPAGRTIRLPFIILKSRSGSPRPDPVLYTAGGPGGSTLFRARFFSRSALLDERDVILLEQRGNRFADPALLCPEIDAALRSGWGSRLNGEPDPKAVEAALRQALGALREAGIDPEAYTTPESAADIADLRRLLGLGSLNLYGVSYSTKLMLTVVRDHPEGIRAAILDSVLPFEANCDEETPANIVDSLEKVFAACREDARLRERFPRLKERFYRLLAEANRSPVEIVLEDRNGGGPLHVEFDGAGLMNCIYAGLEDTSAIPRIPLIIDSICRGETERLTPLAESFLFSTQGTAWGMRISVWSNEEFPFERPPRILEPAGLPRELARFVQPQVPLAALSLWPHGRPEARENEPVRSGVPALVAAGEFDPDTPVKWSRGTAALLPHAHFVGFAGYSHCPLYSHPEAARILREFLDDPSRRPDTKGTSERPPFLASWEEGQEGRRSSPPPRTSVALRRQVLPPA
jgi:pimeloyl-ACP methyl ester carboxylesterase